MGSNRDSLNWPAPVSELDSGASFFRQAAADGTVVVVFHGDADGVCAGVLVVDALHRLGANLVVPLPLEKGESVHQHSARKRIEAHRPQRLVIVDTGSRDQPLIAGVPTLVIDHHQPEGIPRDATFISSFGHDPVAPAALLTFTVASRATNLDDRRWLAVVGTVGDLGIDTDLQVIKRGRQEYGRGAISETVALLNAAKRSAEHDIATSFSVLEQATAPADIAKRKVAGVDKLTRYRQEVNDEVTRASRTKPLFVDRVALIRFSSPAQVHPLVAIRWARRLPDKIVIAANDGYLPGRVNFAMRTQLDLNLVDYLRGLGLGQLEGEYGYGHPRASGGSLVPTSFAQLLRAMGFLVEKK